MNVNDSRIIEMFEEKMAEYAGAKYGVAISSQTNAIFLCFEMLKHLKQLKKGETIHIPKRTYMSVPMTILNIGCKIKFDERKWSGAYQLLPTKIWDSAVRITKDMYVKDSLYCISFQYKKGIPIGRGGMVLTDSKLCRDLLRKLRFNGRTTGITQVEDIYTIRGWNMYMMPEQAARGLTLMSIMAEKNKDVAGFQDYPDLSKQEIFR